MLDKIDRFIRNNNNVFASIIYNVQARTTKDHIVQLDYEERIRNEHNENIKMDLQLELFHYLDVPMVVELKSFTPNEFGSLYGQLPLMSSHLSKFVEAEYRYRKNNTVKSYDIKDRNRSNHIRVENVESVTPEEENTDKLTSDAVTFCVLEYKNQLQSGKKPAEINQRGIALDAVKNYFPELTGKARAKKIDSLRNSYLQKVK